MRDALENLSRIRHFGEAMPGGAITRLAGVAKTVGQRRAECADLIRIERIEERLVAHAHEAGLKLAFAIGEPDFRQRLKLDFQRQHFAVHEHAVTVENDGVDHETSDQWENSSATAE